MPMRPPIFIAHGFQIPPGVRIYQGYTVDPPPPKRAVPSIRTLVGERLLVDKMAGTTTGEEQKLWKKAQRYLSMGLRIELNWKREELPNITIHK